MFNDDFVEWPCPRDMFEQKLRSFTGSHGLSKVQRLRLRRKQWLTKDNVVLKISDMTTSHIDNCLKLLNQSENSTYLGNKYKKLFEAELSSREKQKLF